MDAAEFKEKYLFKLVARNLKEPDKVTVLAAYQSLTTGQKTLLQRAMEQNKFTKAIQYLQRSRTAIATTMADARLDEILADNKIDITTELDELTNGN